MAVATCFFCDGYRFPDMVLYDIMARDQILRNESMQLALLNLTEGAPVSSLRLFWLSIWGVKLAINLKGQMKQAPVDATSSH